MADFFFLSYWYDSSYFFWGFFFFFSQTAGLRRSVRGRWVRLSVARFEPVSNRALGLSGRPEEDGPGSMGPFVSGPV